MPYTTSTRTPGTVSIKHYTQSGVCVGGRGGQGVHFENNRACSPLSRRCGCQQFAILADALVQPQI